MLEGLKVKLHGTSTLSTSIKDANVESIKLVTSSDSGTRNYDRLTNKPSINEVTLIGNKTSEDLHIVSENTSSGWNEKSTYVPKRGEICLYSDTMTIKIGDGSVPIIDLPFVKDDQTQTILDTLLKHINNSEVHVTQEEKQFWSNKLNYVIDDEELIFNRR